MQIILSTKSETPIYDQLFQQISAQILSGALVAHECLPSIRSIAKDLSISVITVKKAYDVLEENGFIYTQAGRGCFVAPFAMSHLQSKKIEIAEAQLKKDLAFYQALGVSQDELFLLIQKIQSEENSK